ncbi:hypothetical protein D3C81_288500 [compost metagenome]
MVIGRADNQQVVGTALQIGTNGIRWSPGNEVSMFTGNPMLKGEVFERLLAGVVPGQVTLTWGIAVVNADHMQCSTTGARQVSGGLHD